MFHFIKMLTFIVGTIIIIATSASAQEKINIPVSGACGMCQERIETAALKVIGINTATYNIDKQMLSIEVQSLFQKKELVDALLALGHDTDGQKANDEAYEALHGCCHYRSDTLSQQENDEHTHSEHDGHDHSENDGHDHSEHDGHDHGDNKSNQLTGTVFEKTDNGAMMPLIGANIRWSGSNDGTVSDLMGYFSIPYSGKKEYLIVSYVGYSPDTMMITKAG